MFAESLLSTNEYYMYMTQKLKNSKYQTHTKLQVSVVFNVYLYMYRLESYPKH